MTTHRLASRIHRHRRALVAAIAALTVVGAGFAAQVGFEGSVDIWFLEDDDAMVTRRAFVEHFDSDEAAVLGIFADDVFEPDTLALIDRVTRAAETAPHAARVRSLSNVTIARADGDDVHIGPLVRSLPTTPSAAAALRAEAMDVPLLSGLVARDGAATAVVVELAPSGSSFAGKVELVTALREIIAAEPDARIGISGSPAFDDATFRHSVRDTMIMGPIMFALVCLLLVLFFRSVAAAVLCLSVVGVANIWLFGLMGALGVDLNLLSSVLGSIVLAVGVADSVHVVTELSAHLRTDDDVERATVAGLAAVLKPCFFTTITTVAGLLSLTTSDLAPVRELGVLAATAVSFAFIVSITLVPALFALTPRLRPTAEPMMSTFAPRLQLKRRGARWATVLISAGAVIAALIALPWLRVGANSMNYFRADDPIRVDTYAMDAALGGSGTLELYVNAPNGGFDDPAVLARLAALQREIESDPLVPQTVSVVDRMVELRRVMGGPAEVPDSEEMVAQLYLLMGDDADLSTMLTDDHETGRITARVAMSGDGRVDRLLPWIEGRLAEDYDDEHLSIEMTGFVKMIGKVEQYLLESQIRSLGLAFIVVSLLMVLLFGSVRVGLFAMIPNLGPIVMGLGLMAALGVPLDPGTVMIGSISMGLVVDDTVHLLSRLTRALEGGASMDEAIRVALSRAGTPIVLTSAILAGGFLVLALGSFRPNINFGLITAVIIALAVVFDLFVLPAVLSLIGAKSTRGGTRTAREMPEMPEGWYGVAFSAEVEAETDRVLGGRQLRLQRVDGRVRELGGAAVIEQAGAVLVHHGEAQRWRPVPADDDGWCAPVAQSWRIRTHPQEIIENTVDSGHFSKVHGYRAVDVLERMRTEGPHLRAAYAVTRTHGLFGPLDRRPLRLEMQICASGLGYSRVEVDLAALGVMVRQVVMPTPIDDEHLELRALTSVKAVARPAGLLGVAAALLPKAWLTWAICRGAAVGMARDVRHDFAIWENKVYVERPALCASDGPIGEYRRWARQFYAAGGAT